MAKNQKFYKITKLNVSKIFNVLKSHGDFLSVSEIAKRSNLHKWTVSRTIDIWMSNVVDIIIPEELEDVGLKIKLVRLIDERMTEEQVLRSISLRNNIMQ